jgi:hypothetical protein
MPTEIPLDPTVRGDASSFRLGTSLGDDQVILDVRWNSRDGAWYMDLYDQDETPIVRSVKLVLGVNLCRASTHPIFTRNLLRMVDTSRSGREATLDDLGTRVVLLHYTRDELYG